MWREQRAITRCALVVKAGGFLSKIGALFFAWVFLGATIAAATQALGKHPELPPGVPYAAPLDPVRIASIKLSAYNVRSGDTVSARVITTSNAAALTARIGDYQVNVPKVAPGTFALRIQVPRVAVPGHRVDIMVTAIRSDGASTQRAVTVFVYYF